jgi:hypothetical protein
MYKFIAPIIALDFLVSLSIPSLAKGPIDQMIPAEGSPFSAAPIHEKLAQATKDLNTLQTRVGALQITVAALQTRVAALQRSVVAFQALTEAIINTRNIIHGSIKDSYGTPIAGTDQNPGYFGHPLAIFGTSGSQNSLVGEVTNNLSAPTFSFPTGITGYGNEASQGNHAFGVYGLGELTSTTGGVTVGAEFTARNLSGHAADTHLPPRTYVGTTTNVVTGINDTCGVQTGTTDCSIGLNISNESGIYSAPVFNTAVYLALFRQYGLFIDSQPGGSQVSAMVKNNGDGIHLELQTTGKMQANNEVLSVLDASNVSHFSIRQNGDIHVNNLVMGAAVQLTNRATGALPNCGPDSEGWEYAVTDSNSGSFNAAFTGGGSNHIIGYCNGTQWVVH